MKIDNLYIIDWYDNVITSIILSDNKKYFLNCININFIDNQKTYYCVELDNNSFDKILKIIKKSNLIKNDWNTINLILNKINSLGSQEYIYRNSLLSAFFPPTFSFDKGCPKGSQGFCHSPQTFRRPFSRLASK